MCEMGQRDADGSPSVTEDETLYQTHGTLQDIKLPLLFSCWEV